MNAIGDIDAPAPVTGQESELAAESLDAVLGRLKQTTRMLTPEQAEAREAREKAARHSGRICELKATWDAPARHAKVVISPGGEWSRILTGLQLKLGTGFLTVIHGTNGNGKTQLGVELMRHQIEARLKSARFTSSTEFFMAVKATYRPDSTKDEGKLIEEFIKPGLLVMDELEKRGESAWENNLLFHLFNRRYNAERDTLLISNLPQSALDEHLGKALVSRLNETGGMIHCDWPSRR